MTRACFDRSRLSFQSIVIARTRVFIRGNLNRITTKGTYEEIR